MYLTDPVESSPTKEDVNNDVDEKIETLNSNITSFLETKEQLEAENERMKKEIESLKSKVSNSHSDKPDFFLEQLKIASSLEKASTEIRNKAHAAKKDLNSIAQFPKLYFSSTYCSLKPNQKEYKTLPSDHYNLHTHCKNILLSKDVEKIENLIEELQGYVLMCSVDAGNIEVAKSTNGYFTEIELELFREVGTLASQRQEYYESMLQYVKDELLNLQLQ